MMKWVCGLVLLTLTYTAMAQQDSVEHRIVLVGDAGELVNGQAVVLDAIKRQIPLDKKTTVIYLGDNLYNSGLPNDTYIGYSKLKEALDSQIALVKGTDATAFMIPGNHDWQNGGVDGYDNILRQQRYVDAAGDGKVIFYPKKGCPGPESVDLSDNAVLVMFDSQWWLHTNEKPGVESDCDCKTKEEVLEQLDDILSKNYDKLVILACHHPFKSNGPHGGYYTWKQHLFPFTDLNRNLYIPLPVLGSAYPISRSVFGTPQDIRHPLYQDMINRVMSVVKDHPHVVMVAGHEHTLQLLKDSSYNYIVSGSGSKTNRVSPGGKSEFTARERGFAVLEVLKNKSVRVNFYELPDVSTDTAKEAYTENILDFSELPPLAEDTTTTPNFIYKDYVVAPASKQYEKTTKVQRIFNGTNYRQEWSTPVKFKVFNINKEHGGFKIEGIGGGKQTKSLKLEDKQGRNWALRTIDKDPEKAIPDNLRQSFASDIVRDLISAANPYAPLTIPTLADTLGVIAPAPEFFFVPDDPSLGYYRPLFANKICMLERKDPADNDNDSKSSFELFNKMREDNDHTVRQEHVLTARLLDMLVADWDRHFDQWKWATKDTGKGKTYDPIPRDRDQAFFDSDGLIVWYVARRRIPYLKGFRYDIPKINNLNYVARNFDRMYLNSIDRPTWEKLAHQFTTELTDKKIEEAVLKMPPEIYAIRGKEITDKLKSRRDLLEKESMTYYDFLSREVTVLGSNENEFFHVEAGEKNMVKLTVYSYRKGADTNFVMYERSFDPSITREIQMYGFNGADRFLVDPDVRARMKIRMIGGKGEDTFNVQGHLRSFVYDNVNEKNVITEKVNTRVKIENDPNINEFKINHFEYPVKRYPRILAGFNADDGLMLGTGFWFVNYGFRKEPFASSHKFVSLFAITRKAVQLQYDGVMNHTFGKYDLLVHAQYNAPGLRNFFGFGNNTTLDPDKEISFYRTRYHYIEGDVLLRKRIFSKFEVHAGPSFYYYNNEPEDNRDYILAKPQEAGLDSAEVYSHKYYAGLKAGFELNNINNELFPTRGIDWTANYTALKGLTDNSHSLRKLQSDMVIYASMRANPRVIGVIRAGAGKIYTDSVQYFQALTLGQNNVLRGFRKDRFAGDAMAYGSLELRIKLFDSHSYIFPGQIGLVAFNDIGRVWYRGESSQRWHNVTGGGLYYNPFNLFILSATTGFSKEGTIYNIGLATKFNFTF